MRSPAATDAATIRSRLKAKGHNVKGVVRVLDNPGISTEIEIDSRYIPEDDLVEAMNDLRFYPGFYSFSVS